MHETYWAMPVVLYLFLAGLGAGAVAVSASVLLRGGGFGGSYFTLARYGALLGPIPVIVGTAFIILELGRPFRALNLFKVINLSPMSIGSWALAIFIVLSLLYALSFLPSLFSRYSQLSFRLAGVRKALAWVNLPFGIGVAVYTGILLGAMPGRPLWNSPILAFLFLISALSTGVALIMLVAAIFHRETDNVQAEGRYHQTAYLLTSSDALFIGIELMVIFLFVMFAHLTVGDVKYAMRIIMPGGEMATMFWLWVVLIGLILPGVVEVLLILPRMLYHLEYSAPKLMEITVSVAVLVGGFMLRYVIVIAGQVTGPTGL